jgi:adenylate cyclase
MKRVGEAGAFPLEQPFPLRSLFQRRFIPAFLGFTALFLLVLGITAQHVIEQIYLELAQRRAQTIARAVAEAAPTAWAHLMAGQSLTELRNSTDAAALAKAFTDEVREMNLAELKIYDIDGRVLFATNADEIGGNETGDALRRVIADASAEIVTKVFPDGTKQYELYVPVYNDRGAIASVFELYEPVNYLDTIILKAAVPTMAVPAGLLLILVITLNALVARAQRDIDQRTQALKALRERLSSFVSATATVAARSVDERGDITSRKLRTTLLYSDIRDFTGFAEKNAPEVVVDFLNRVMTLQIEAAKRNGGDVDKMIGDAILVRFDGADGPARALSAARQIQQSMHATQFPRALGIGLHQGDVISGAIGPSDRRDFTIIGDTVNLAARLCALAGRREIVADAEIADGEFGPVESVQVKGRSQAVLVRRLTSDDSPCQPRQEVQAP